jgi:hypothetical protein
LLHRTILRWVAVLAVAIWGLGNAASGHAAQVLVLGSDGHVRTEEQPLPAWTKAPPPRPRIVRSTRRHRRVGVIDVLGRLRDRGEISSSAYQSYAASMRAALTALKTLRGTPARELSAVIGNLRAMASSRTLTPGRLRALFMTLDRNRQWWTSEPVPAANQVVNFAGSEIDWEYYPGQGLELQELANFFKTDWLFTHGSAHNNYQRGEALLSELIPLASRRAGGVSWEYFFNFDGGSPPWISAMSQGTGLEALTDAYKATGDRNYLSIAGQALPVLRTSPGRGVNVHTKRGIRFVQYSFAPARRDEVLNAFLQTLIGLHDYAQASGDSIAWHLFNAGDREARHEVPFFDTGRWSLYQPGIADSVSYHDLVTGFLQQLCSIVHAPVYCTTAAHFQRYSQHPPPGVS